MTTYSCNHFGSAIWSIRVLDRPFADGIARMEATGQPVFLVTKYAARAAVQEVEHRHSDSSAAPDRSA